MSTPTTEADPDAVAAAVLSCPAVARLSGGLAGEVATYLPGRRVTGVRLRAEQVQVNVVGRYGPSIEELAGQVRSALRPLVGGLPIRIEVDDIAVPGEDDIAVPGEHDIAVPGEHDTAVPGEAERGDPGAG